MIIQSWQRHLSTSGETKADDTWRNQSTKMRKNEQRHRTSTLYTSTKMKHTQANSHPSVLPVPPPPPTPRPLNKPSISQILTSNERNNALCRQFENNNYCKKADISYARHLCSTQCNLFNARNLVACFSWQFASLEHVVTSSFPQIVDSPFHFLRYT